MNLVKQLERNAREYPNKPAVIFRGSRINYSELNDLVDKLAGSLMEMGLKKGDRVGLMLPRNPQLVVSFLAIAKAGAIVVPINYELAQKDIRACLTSVCPLCLIVSTSFLDTARRAMPPDFQIPIIEIGDVVGERLLWSAMLTKGKGSNPAVDIKDDDIVYLNYTSGSTETTGIALANRPGGSVQPGSVGKPCASYEVMLVDEDGVELPADEIGEMAFKGPAVVQGYYENTISNQECFRDGWYYSGDLARKDDQNNFYFMGRKNGMMKVAGLKVYPQEIEQVLMDHPDIKEAVVISARHKLRGEVPKAIIVTTNGQGLMEKDIRAFCRDRLAHYKMPRIVELRESLPKTSSGKTNKKALAEEHV